MTKSSLFTKYSMGQVFAITVGILLGLFLSVLKGMKPLRRASSTDQDDYCPDYLQPIVLGIAGMEI